MGAGEFPQLRKRDVYNGTRITSQEPIQTEPTSKS